MEDPTQGPKGPKPFRFKGTPAAKSRHNFAVLVLLAGAGVAFLMERSPGMQRTFRKYQEFDKRFEDDFESSMTREQFFNFGIHQIYTKEGGAVKAKKKYDETHEDDPIFVA